MARGLYLKRRTPMKYLPFVIVLVALAPGRVYSQNQQVSDCRTLEAAGRIVGSDEALVNGWVCKVGKAKLPPQAATKATEKSMALLGIIEPEILRSKEKEGANSVSPEPTAEATPGSVPSGAPAGGATPPSSFATITGKSLGEIARSYRNEARARITTKADEEVKQVAAPPNVVPVVATVVQPQTATKKQVYAAADPAAGAEKRSIIAAVPATV